MKQRLTDERKVRKREWIACADENQELEDANLDLQTPDALQRENVVLSNACMDSTQSTAIPEEELTSAEKGREDEPIVLADERAGGYRSESSYTTERVTTGKRGRLGRARYFGSIPLTTAEDEEETTFYELRVLTGQDKAIPILSHSQRLSMFPKESKLDITEEDLDVVVKHIKPNYRMSYLRSDKKIKSMLKENNTERHTNFIEHRRYVHDNGNEVNRAFLRKKHVILARWSVSFSRGVIPR